jgi:LPXTG-motif cell wall-anchored protein
MKRMNKVSKSIFATLMVSTIVGASAIPAFAANTVISDGDPWINSDYVAADVANNIAEDLGTARLTNHSITVTNVSDTSANLVVTAYQLVKGTYKDGKLTGYVLCDATNAAIANMEAPTVNEITTIANNIRANTTTLQGIVLTKGTGAASSSYSAVVEAGLYVVLASGSDGVVYNPAIVAVNVDDANDLDDHDPDPSPETPTNDGRDKNGVDATSVSLASYWEIPNRAYLKSSTTSFNKDVLGSEASPFVVAENTEGDITSKGAIVSFKLDGMVIPTYSAEYAAPDGQDENGVIYKIQDKLDNVAFAGITDLVVKTNTGIYADTDDDPQTPDVLVETPVTATSSVDDDNDPQTPNVTVTNYTLVYKNASGTVVTDDDIATSAVSYELQFSDAWLRANAEKNVTVEYKARFTENAAVNGVANKTVATLSYTVDPDDNTGVEVLRDSTYHYTFEIGGQIDATADGTDGTVDGVASFHDYTINKVTEALAANANYEADLTTGEFSSEHALAGATFTLYDDDTFTTIHQNKVRNATTGVWTTEDATYTTTADGRLVFTGLDVGTYYLKETVAPDNYTLNTNDYKVVIAGTIADGTGAAEQGTLTGYTINVYVKDGANWTSIGSSSYTITPAVTAPSTDATAMNFDEIVNTITTNVTPAEVVDTPLAALPATGGAGTIAITLIAAVGMGGFLTLYLVNRKKSKKEQ